MDVSSPGAGTATSSRLDGASLDRLSLLLLVGGGLGTLLFTAVYLIEGATQPGYDVWVQPISSLSLGPGGWVQRANFVLFGATTIGCSAIGWHRALRPGFGTVAYPVLRSIEGAALILLGFFAQDPTGGYPPGVPAPATPSLHGEIHVVLSYVGFVSLLSSLLLARRFAMEPLWRGWVWPTVLFAILPSPSSPPSARPTAMPRPGCSNASPPAPAYPSGSRSSPGSWPRPGSGPDGGPPTASDRDLTASTARSPAGTGSDRTASTTPCSVIRARTRAAGVTSKAGFQAGVPGGAKPVTSSGARSSMVTLAPSGVRRSKVLSGAAT